MLVANGAPKAPEALFRDVGGGVGPVIRGQPVLLRGGGHRLVHPLLLSAAGALAASMLQRGPQLVWMLVLVGMLVRVHIVPCSRELVCNRGGSNVQAEQALAQQVLPPHVEHVASLPHSVDSALFKEQPGSSHRGTLSTSRYCPKCCW